MDRFLEQANKRMGELGVTSAEVAKACGMTRLSLYNILKGKHRPSLPRAAKLAYFLGLSLDETLGLSATDVEGARARFSKPVESEENTEASENASSF